MKKLFLAICLISGLALASCGGQGNANNASSDSVGKESGATGAGGTRDSVPGQSATDTAAHDTTAVKQQ